ncbi:hypothetical protein GALL_437550 [mine drainage metagenome]|uniref:Uncharacterized protein n=1 Tax=mine drainage metagenome TaxID=410659 RepID=A0A1J5Q3M5_9ZZZZ
MFGPGDDGCQLGFKQVLRLTREEQLPFVEDY